MIDENEYLEKRLDDQINWYSNKSTQNKKYHIRGNVASIVCSALISLLAGFDLGNQTGKNAILGILGTTIAIITGLASLLKYQDKWTEYRTTAETLTQEKMMYNTLTGPYDNQAEPFKTLVSRVENIISKENSTWKQYVIKSEAEKPKG